MRPYPKELEQHVALRDRPFVVQIQGAAAIADGAVIDYRTQLARDLLSDAAAESGDAFAVEIGLQAMAYGFVKEDAGPAGAEDDGHLARGALDGVEHGDGFAAGFASEVFGSFFLKEVIEIETAAAAGVSALRRSAVLFGEGGDGEAGERLAIDGQLAVAGGDQDLAQIIGVDGLHLEDARVVSPRGAMGRIAMRS